ncbi:deoxyguanosinetriphosphate triphosphohydrolase [Geopsychrobacter electrodiphilus]|uniref:deoxyguanosinetriphosphate triphosphohydrolase n=1 Tax=Geopsychrobacter electrodiphilus TaxID=225196 RepID=UPI0003638ADE|nr:deoxyguanosinetriphosphate triphosphohydrolase [Geopsychrobacter electrodiphilus]
MYPVKLAAYAAQSSKSRGRVHPEPFKDDRLMFERDRDRIIHCAAFRRLEYKTQVFVNHEGDYYRTRLTHSLEVAQIARGIARALNLNLDLVEALSLAHDLGHTPFGHTGEEVLNRLMQGFGGFEHNQQSLRIVDLLEERYPNFNGLNLSWETREGIIKHSSDYDKAGTSAITEFEPAERATLEAQIIDLADEIAYNNHDIDDGLKAGYIKLKDLAQVDLWQTTFCKVSAKFPLIDEKRQILQTISYLIGDLIHDLVATTDINLAAANIRSLDDLRRQPQKMAAFSVTMQQKNRELKKFLYHNLYRHHKVELMRVKAEHFLTLLFESYIKNPTLLPRAHQEKFDEHGRERVICDYIASMTDRFAQDEYKKLYEPFERA